MKLTKTQTLALFLGVATPAAIDVLNGPSTEGNVPEGQSLTTASSGTACNGNAECTADGEVCGSY
jgi:hypothetical protein